MDEHQSCWILWVGVATVSLFGSQFVNIPDAYGQEQATTVAEQLDRYEFLQIRMGIPVTLTLYAPSRDAANVASTAAFDRFREIDRIMSDYDPDSELMQLCQFAQPDEPVSISDDLFEVLSAAQQLSRKTQGAFDVTIGPVGRLWRLARRKEELPDFDRLAEARDRVGYQSLVLDPNQRTVTLRKEGMQLDLGGIAKGYAADVALESMKQYGVTRVLIDAGGDLVAGDPPPGREFWRVEVEQRDASDQEESTRMILKVKNCGVATSGDTYQYLEIDGKRYSHLVNPKTGLGVTVPASVTVVASTGMEADSLASALSVLRDRKSIEQLCRDSNAEFLKVELGEDGTRKEIASSGFFERIADSNEEYEEE
ncbi:Thiamine biosynthesis lipoprotein ApbE precursor [Thalassoglobus neptunius]|uniref:FAD:protein FMN transferase n=1 Tax=Thalassoglobus neptunius TaxID=1938619 RepID=A0A5C5X4G2_9PLAN|nr:FAD:protein FMN transferase [Thalassoglobus neptunius]TWT57022.1 Thiamine biosynthesis lipoprotein ApbE precursor [Thalassoglobus neptunius]